jgi:hypothetical protein
MERDPRRRTGMAALALLLTLVALGAPGGPPATAQGQTPPGWQAGIYFNLSADALKTDYQYPYELQPTLDDQPSPQPLRAPDGKTLAWPAKNPLGGITPSILLLVVVEAAICGTATVLLAALGLLLWRSLRPQPAVTWVPVSGAPLPAAWLLIASPLGNFPPLLIPPNGLTIGRTAANQLAINDVQISRCHARIQFINGVWLVTDLGSANGTLVNGVRIKRQPLRNGDRITIGQTTLTVRAIFHG